MRIELAEALDGEVNLEKLHPLNEASFPFPLQIEGSRCPSSVGEEAFFDQESAYPHHINMQEVIRSAHYSSCCYSRRICKDQESLANAAIHNA